MIIARSPLRISLGGGGTDLPSYYEQYGGFLVAAAIDKYVYITLHHNFTAEFIVKYSRLERVKTVEERQHPNVPEALKLARLQAVCVPDGARCGNAEPPQGAGREEQKRRLGDAGDSALREGARPEEPERAGAGRSAGIRPLHGRPLAAQEGTLRRNDQFADQSVVRPGQGQRRGRRQTDRRGPRRLSHVLCRGQAEAPPRDAGAR